MAVYVDDAFIPFGRMKMSHLTADSLPELHAFARKIGLRREWFQDKSIPHYDVSISMRNMALAYGATAERYFTGTQRERDRIRALRRKPLERRAVRHCGGECLAPWGCKERCVRDETSWSDPDFY